VYQVVYKLHPAYELMLQLQLGIRWVRRQAHAAEHTLSCAACTLLTAQQLVICKASLYYDWHLLLSSGLKIAALITVSSKYLSQQQHMLAAGGRSLKTAMTMTAAEML